MRLDISASEFLSMDKKERAKYLYKQAEKSGKRLNPICENLIIYDPRSAYEYTRWFLRRRWPEAEPYIAKDGEATEDYVKFMIEYYGLRLFDNITPRTIKIILKDICNNSECIETLSRDMEEAYKNEEDWINYIDYLNRQTEWEMNINMKIIQLMLDDLGITGKKLK